MSSRKHMPSLAKPAASSAPSEAEARQVWAALEAEPGFKERLAKATTDLANGRAVPYGEVRRRR